MVIAIVVALIVGLAAIGSHSSGGGKPVAVPSIAIPTFATGLGSSGRKPSSTGQPQSQPTNPAPANRSRSGRTLDLNGSFTGERIRITFTKIVNTATPKNKLMDTPGKGERLFAAQFRITNTGTFPYVDSPSSSASVIDSKGHSYKAAFLFGSLRQGRAFGSAITLNTGSTAVGFVAFQVPKTARIRKVQFIEGGSTGDPAVWTLHG